MIPEKWKLEQNYFDKNIVPKKFPVFMKPEWGQNSNGIVRIDSLDDFLACDYEKSKIPYIVQELAVDKNEYEIFYIRDYRNTNELITITITQSINNSNEDYPINGVKNKNVEYKDITNDFSAKEIVIIKNNLKQLPDFRIARFGIKSNSKEDLLKGLFKIIEINLFAPLPINLLDNKVDKSYKHKFIKKNMRNLVMISSLVPKKNFNRFVFFKKIIRHNQSKK
jgi:hypothetical protein